MRWTIRGHEGGLLEDMDYKRGGLLEDMDYNEVDY